jgi:hypothetical protein
MVLTLPLGVAMKWLRKFRVLGLTLALLVGLSCTSSDGAFTGPSEPEPAQEPSQDLSSLTDGLGGLLGGTTDLLGGAIGGLLEITDLLTCSRQEYVSVEETIGPKGGTIRVGDHVLVIPKNALSRKVKIRAEQMRGSTNSVRFSPDGLRFEKRAVLTMSYKNCVIVLLPKTIVYTTEKFKVLEVLLSLDLFRQKTVTAPIDHFSRYAVAY